MVVDTLNASTFSWHRFDGIRVLNVSIRDMGVPTGGGSGLGLRSGAFMNPSTIAHELGHVLDAWLLESWDRQTIRDRYCRHLPQHPWYGNADVAWGYRMSEDFANAYEHTFHGGGSFGAGHPFDGWFHDFILSRPVKEPIWI